MKRLLILLLCILIPQIVEATVLQAGVSIDEVPKALYGSWRISAKLDRTDAPGLFKPQSIDFWTLSRVAEVIKLENPFSGASAEISVETIEGNLVVFSKKLPYDGNKVLTDTVTLRLDKNNFSGVNSLKLESYSLLDNHLMKTQTATYIIKGEKIAGDNVIE